MTVKCKQCKGTGIIKEKKERVSVSGMPSPRTNFCNACALGQFKAMRYDLSELTKSMSWLSYTIQAKNETLTRGVNNQIIHFSDGQKRTISNVKKIWENEMTHIVDGEGTEWIINKDNVNVVEVTPNNHDEDEE
jgi:hypothetical protein